MSYLLQDAWRSLCRSKWEHLLTMSMLALVLWATTLVFSYYVDVPLAPHTQQALYPMHMETADDAQLQQNVDAALGMLLDPSSMQTLRQVLREMQAMDAVKYVRSVACAVLLPNAQFAEPRRQNLLEPYLAEPIYRPSLLALAYDMSQEVPVVDLQKLSPKSDKPEAHPLIDEPLLAVQAVRVDEAAARLFDLQAETGRVWDAQDFVWSNAASPVPVMLGSAYRDLFAPEDTIELYDEYIHTIYTARIIGFLPEGAALSHVSYDRLDTIQRTLDYSVLLPIFTSAPALGYLEASNDSLTYQSGGMVSVPSSLGRAEFAKAQRDMNDISVRNGYPPLFFGTPTFGLMYFQTESAASMATLLRIVLLAIIFCTVLVCLRFIAQARRNLRGYAVRVMLGVPISTVAGSFLIEMLVVLAIPTIAVGCIFWQQIAANWAFVLLIGVVQLVMAVLLGGMLVGVLLRMNVEQAIRGPE